MQSHCHHSPFPSTESLSKISWNIMERFPTIPSPMPLCTDITHWAVNGKNVEIPSTWACVHRNLAWLDKTHAFTLWEGFKAKDTCHSCIIFEIIHVSISVHHAVSLSSFVIPIKGIFIKTLLKCHGTSSNEPITNAIIHWRHTLSSEWGQRLNSFKLWLYTLKFDMVRLNTYLHNMGGFEDSRMHDLPA